jgi:RNA-binding protein Musashi
VCCSEDTLRLHFSQYGSVEATEVMKDRVSGKSRGFGFVTFVDPACAAAALQMEHTIDGRRCEAKVALPKVRASAQQCRSLAVPGCVQINGCFCSH